MDDLVWVDAAFGAFFACGVIKCSCCLGDFADWVVVGSFEFVYEDIFELVVGAVLAVAEEVLVFGHTITFTKNAH